MSDRSSRDVALEFVRYFCEQFCEHKDDISVVMEEDDRGFLILVSVNPSDMGKLIGKDGQTISAVRLLVRTIGARENQKISLKVLETETNRD